MDILSNAFVGTHMERSSRDPHGIAAAYENGLCVQIFEKLWEHYPKYDWKVKVDAHGGFAQIQLPRLHRSTFGYIIKLDKLAGDPALKAVVRAAGEMLERWKLRRGTASKAEYVDVIRNTGRVFSFRDEIPGGYKGQAKRLIVPAHLANDNRPQIIQAAA